ncbi:MAG: GNAT family N-acetyltransferase [Acetatifactor sp.]|nr:GNAT family N-acetyltransferase [Acetatifactor sp.]
MKRSETDVVTIRLAAEQDYDAVARIMRQVHNMHVDWRPDIYMDIDPILPYDMYLAHLAQQQVIVAEVAGEVVGLIIYLTRNISGGPMRERKVLYVDSMAVEEQYRGQGIGHKLFDYVLRLCQEQQYDGLELQVNAKNAAARAMYEKYGFTEKSITMEFLGF